MAFIYSFWNYLGKVLLSVLGLGGIIGGIALIKFAEGDSFGLTVAIILLVAGICLLAWCAYSIVKMAHGGNKRCKNCGKWFADECVKSVSEGSYETTKTVSQDIRDRNGNRTGSYDQTVPATCYYGTNYWKCIYCGNKRKERYSNVY